MLVIKRFASNTGLSYNVCFKNQTIWGRFKGECGILFPTHNIHLHTWWWTKHTFFCEIYPWKAKNRVPIFISATHSCSKCNHFHLEVSMYDYGAFYLHLLIFFILCILCSSKCNTYTIAGNIAYKDYVRRNFHVFLRLNHYLKRE